MDENEYMLILYLFINSNIKEIDIYKLSKAIFKTRIVFEGLTVGEQNKNENKKIK